MKRTFSKLLMVAIAFATLSSAPKSAMGVEPLTDSDIIPFSLAELNDYCHKGSQTPLSVRETCAKVGMGGFSLPPSDWYRYQVTNQIKLGWYSVVHFCTTQRVGSLAPTCRQFNLRGPNF